MKIRTQAVADADTEMNLSLEQAEGVVVVNAKDSLNRSFVVGVFGPGGFEPRGPIPADTGWPLTDGKITIVS